MDKLSSSGQPRLSGIISAFWLCRPILLILLIGSSLILLLWAEEYVRGKSAWKKCQAELKAKGAVLDWAAFSPALVPDEKNFFKAPKMSEWFERGNNELAGKLSSPGLKAYAKSLIIDRKEVVMRSGDFWVLARHR